MVGGGPRTSRLRGRRGRGWRGLRLRAGRLRLAVPAERREAQDEAHEHEPARARGPPRVPRIARGPHVPRAPPPPAPPTGRRRSSPRTRSRRRRGSSASTPRGTPACAPSSSGHQPDDRFRGLPVRLLERLAGNQLRYVLPSTVIALPSADFTEFFVLDPVACVMLTSP